MIPSTTTALVASNVEHPTKTYFSNNHLDLIGVKALVALVLIGVAVGAIVGYKKNKSLEDALAYTALGLLLTIGFACLVVMYVGGIRFLFS